MLFKRFIHVPISKQKFKYVKSQGPGGQNVNKSKEKIEIAHTFVSYYGSNLLS